MTVNNSNRQESRDALIRFCAGLSAGDRQTAEPGGGLAFDNFLGCDVGNIICPFG